MTQVVTLVPDPRCDDCEGSVELSQIQKSVVNGVSLGPYQCVSCETQSNEKFEANLMAYTHHQTVQQSSFEEIANQYDPKLAEAIHRAHLTEEDRLRERRR